MYMSAGANRGQKGVSDPGAGVVFGYGPSDWGHLQEQHVLLSADPSLRPQSSPSSSFYAYYFYIHTPFYTRTHCCPGWPGIQSYLPVSAS